MIEKIHTYEDGLTRCHWPKQNREYLDYHDKEWGVEVRDDEELFEHLSLEGFQAGLSWITILQRRDEFRKAFKGFEVDKVARFGETQIERLMQNPGIIRNRAKINAVINNARLIKTLDRPLNEIIWEHAPKKKLQRVSLKNFEWRATSPESEALSKSLRALGFAFVGPTSMYAMMQSIGMVNDHAPGCFRREQLRD
ncbi:MAG: DNA-3-methyladenine glycosylase I [Actinomycetota bacterium]